MSKAAFVILAAGNQPESIGRVVNALMALEYIELGAEVHVIFDAAGTQAAADLARTKHKYHELFEQIRGRVTGVCSIAPKRMGSKSGDRGERVAAHGSVQGASEHQAACGCRVPNPDLLRWNRRELTPISQRIGKCSAPERAHVWPTS